ncbi:MAG: hypothetical protein WD204_08120, partial [Acidimicrobiia bacterium]
MNRLLTIAFLLFLVAPTSIPAAAQAPDDVSDELELRRYYIGEGVDISIDEMEDLVDRFEGFGFVALGATPDGGADLLADRLLDGAPSVETIVVLTADEAGAASAVYDDEALDDAFDVVFATTGDTYLRDFEQVASALVSPTDTFPPGPDVTIPPVTPAGEGRMPVVWLPVAGAVVFAWAAVIGLGVVGYRKWHNRQDDETAASRRFAEAQREIEAQVAVVADQILELSDRPDLPAHTEATAHFRAASEVFRSAEERLAEATTTADFEALSDDLDDARWELAAADALLAGRPVPDKPEDDHPPPCFFDPTHGAGTETAELATATGTRTVMVCGADAGRLRQGDHPAPRTVTVDGRATPAPQAPRSHGGGGMDG